MKNNKTTKITATIITSLVIGLMISSPMTILPNVSAQSSTIHLSKSYAPAPVLARNGTGLNLAPASTSPYVAAYHDLNPHIGIKSAKVTCNFAGTNRANIQSDNYLTCVEGLQNPTSTNGEDWGYQAYVTLKQTGNLIVGADVWKGCEINEPTCNGTPSGTVEHKFSSSQFITASVSDDVTVFEEWDSTGNTVNWYYQINSGSKTLFASWTKVSEQNMYFNTGVYQPVPGGLYARYFQAGVASAYNIGQGGWFVNVKNPAYATTQGGAYNSFYSPAKSTTGQLSYWDDTFNWGGATYTGVNANYNCNSGTAAGQIKFQYTGVTLADSTKLWGTC